MVRAIRHRVKCGMDSVHQFRANIHGSSIAQQMQLKAENSQEIERQPNENLQRASETHEPLLKAYPEEFQAIEGSIVFSHLLFLPPVHSPIKLS